jgi:hypothetical protein
MISSNLHGAEEPTRWMLRPHQGAETGQRWPEALHQRRGGLSTRGTLAELDLGGLCLLHWNVDPRRPRTSPMMIMTSSSLVDAWEADLAVLARVAGWRSPRRANVLLQEAAFALKGANVTLRGHDVIFFCLIRV